jgi:hypothetical protein
MYGKAGARWWRSCERSRCYFKTLHDRRNIGASEGGREGDEDDRTSHCSSRLGGWNPWQYNQRLMKPTSDSE